MQHKKIILFVTLIVLFSLSGFSQASSTSEHPLLDKYYPQKKADTNKTVVNEIKPAVIKPEPVAAPPAVKTAPVVVTPSPVKAVPETAPVVKTAPVPETVPAIEPPVVTPSPVSAPVSPISTTTAVATTPVINKPAIDTTRIAATQKIQPRPAPEEPYNPSRLGSSSRLYDTYKKNSNGAGSVTTLPK
jgi:hypothetical protein